MVGPTFRSGGFGYSRAAGKVGRHRVVNPPREILRDALSNRAARDRHRAGRGIDQDIPTIPDERLLVRGGAGGGGRLGPRLARVRHEPAVDHQPHAADRGFLNRLVADVQPLAIFGDVDEVGALRQLRDDRAAAHARLSARPFPPLAMEVERRAHEEREDEERQGDEAGDEIPHGAAIE